MVIINYYAAYLKNSQIFVLTMGCTLLRPASDASSKGAGKTIGYLERITVLFLLVFGQFTAVGFVISAKSIMRFPEISKAASNKAEYYLIGTLLSMASVFMTAVLLALIPAQ